MVKDRHSFGIHDWPEKDYLCDRVLNSGEKALLKEYESEVLKRRNKAEMVAKRKIGEGKDVEASVSKQLRVSKKAKVKTQLDGITLREVLDQLKVYIRTELNDLYEKLKPSHPTSSRKNPTSSRKKASTKGRTRRSIKPVETIVNSVSRSDSLVDVGDKVNKGTGEN